MQSTTACRASKHCTQRLNALKAKAYWRWVRLVNACAKRWRSQWEALFGAYEEALQEWPHIVTAPQAVQVVEERVVEEQAVEEQVIESVEGKVTLEDWLGELREDSEGNRCRLLLLSSSLVSQGRGRAQYRWQHLLRPWVAHLAGNAERPMTTQLLSKARPWRVEPLEAENARYQLHNMLNAWRDGMQAPLPLAPQAAFAWLAKQGTPEMNPRKRRLRRR